MLIKLNGCCCSTLRGMLASAMLSRFIILAGVYAAGVLAAST
jgi:hypothetical protein